MDWWLMLLFQVLPLAGLFYLYINRKYSYWVNLGVRGPEPSIFKFGNAFQIASQAPPVIEVQLMRQFGKLYGNYIGLEPTLTCSDAALIKQILVRDFPSWVNRRKLNGYHEMNNNHQFNAEGNQWKRLRTITGKTFTSGKLRNMQPIMDQCIDRLIEELKILAMTGDGTINTKEIVSGFTIDVIASTSFATETKTRGPSSDKKNPFVENAQRLFDLNPLALLSYLTMPRWFNDFVGVKLPVGARAFEFFVDLTRTILMRRKAGIERRTDLMQLLMDTYAYEAEINDANYDHLTASAAEDDSTKSTESQLNASAQQDRPKSKLSDRDIIAQSVLFLIAGFETTAATISNIIYELAINPTVQDRLREEMKEKLHGLKPNTEAYYEAVMTAIPYLDAVIKETLRKYPPVVRIERRLVDKEYTLAGIPLKQDQLIEISTIAVHYNAEYYPEPEQFNPDRFMPENRHKQLPYTYLPFGDGPRNCVGMRFAYQEIKLCFAKVLPKVKFIRCEKTPPKPQFEKFKPILVVKPFQVKVEVL